MKAQQLRNFLKDRTFYPFLIHTTSGATYEVKNPETVWQTPDAGETVVVYLGPGESVAFLDTAEITECGRPAPMEPTKSD